MAARIKADTGIDPEIIEGSRGEFTVWVGSEQVAKKSEDGFPTDDDAAAAVRRAIRHP